MSDEAVVVFVTVESEAEAEAIASEMVRRRLAACCNRIPGVQSTYWWKGDICESGETLLFFKTTRRLFDRLREEVVRMHSYEVPEVIALPIWEGHAPYLKWIQDETEA